MRLFTAVIFQQNVEASLYETVERLRGLSNSGTFTRRENLHLTINFIGETKRIDEVKRAMNLAKSKVNGKKFILSMHGLGKFKRREGDIYWIGVERENTLWGLQKELVKQLKEAGFYEIDDMEYTPHLTLGRRVQVKKEFDPKAFEAQMKPLQMEVSKISLMKSERVDGKLTYTEIYYVDLD